MRNRPGELRKEDLICEQPNFSVKTPELVTTTEGFETVPNTTHVTRPQADIPQEMLDQEF